MSALTLRQNPFFLVLTLFTIVLCLLLVTMNVTDAFKLKVTAAQISIALGVVGVLKIAYDLIVKRETTIQDDIRLNDEAIGDVEDEISSIEEDEIGGYQDEIDSYQEFRDGYDADRTSQKAIKKRANTTIAEINSLTGSARDARADELKKAEADRHSADQAIKKLTRSIQQCDYNIGIQENNITKARKKIDKIVREKLPPLFKKGTDLEIERDGLPEKKKRAKERLEDARSKLHELLNKFDPIHQDYHDEFGVNHGPIT